MTTTTFPAIYAALEAATAAREAQARWAAAAADLKAARDARIISREEYRLSLAAMNDAGAAQRAIAAGVGSSIANVSALIIRARADVQANAA